jgi:hypothetical protein
MKKMILILALLATTAFAVAPACASSFGESSLASQHANAKKAPKAKGPRKTKAPKAPAAKSDFAARMAKARAARSHNAMASTEATIQP